MLDIKIILKSRKSSIKLQPSLIYGTTFTQSWDSKLYSQMILLHSPNAIECEPNAGSGMFPIHVLGTCEELSITFS